MEPKEPEERNYLKDSIIVLIISTVLLSGMYLTINHMMDFLGEQITDPSSDILVIATTISFAIIFSALSYGLKLLLKYINTIYNN